MIPRQDSGGSRPRESSSRAPQGGEQRAPAAKTSRSWPDARYRWRTTWTATSRQRRCAPAIDESRRPAEGRRDLEQKVGAKRSAREASRRDPPRLVERSASCRSRCPLFLGFEHDASRCSRCETRRRPGEVVYASVGGGRTAYGPGELSKPTARQGGTGAAMSWLERDTEG